MQVETFIHSRLWKQKPYKEITCGINDEGAIFLSMTSTTFALALTCLSEEIAFFVLPGRVQQIGTDSPDNLWN